MASKSGKATYLESRKYTPFTTFPLFLLLFLLFFFPSPPPSASGGEKLPGQAIFHHLRLVQFGMSTHVYTLLRIFANALFQSLHVVNPLPTIAFDNADRWKNIHCRQE